MSVTLVCNGGKVVPLFTKDQHRVSSNQRNRFLNVPLSAILKVGNQKSTQNQSVAKPMSDPFKTPLFN
ncbi:MAG TPA: hypothetical protein VIC26_13505, partial [Marinagarivorans sp.]